MGRWPKPRHRNWKHPTSLVSMWPSWRYHGQHGIQAGVKDLARPQGSGTPSAGDWELLTPSWQEIRSAGICVVTEKRAGKTGVKSGLKLPNQNLGGPICSPRFPGDSAALLMTPGQRLCYKPRHQFRERNSRWCIPGLPPRHPTGTPAWVPRPWGRGPSWWGDSGSGEGWLLGGGGYHVHGGEGPAGGATRGGERVGAGVVCYVPSRGHQPTARMALKPLLRRGRTWKHTR